MESTAQSAIRERGEITIPKKIRQNMNFEAGQEVVFLPLGEDAVLMTPKKLELDEARRRIRKVLKQANVSAEEVLKGLDSSREEVYQKYYSKKVSSKRHAKRR